MEILETKKLTKLFEGVRAVNELSLTIQKATITSIIGPNGSGKTTLINVLSGVLPIDQGAVIIGKHKLKKIKPHLAPNYGITRTFQNIRLFEQMTVLDNILVVLTERKIFVSLFEKHTKQHLERAEKILTRIGLKEKQNELAGNLSYGQRKLLEIGRALAMDAEIYLFDEPFAGLFPQMVETLTHIMKELRDIGKTIILIEHNMNLIRKLSDYVFVMDAGRLLACGVPNQVLKQKEVIEAYLGE